MKVIAIFILAALLFTWMPAHATLWYVHPDSALNSIQAGIDSSANSDTVLVGAGVYLENINFRGKAITVRSEHGPDTTIIDGSNPAHPDTGCVVQFVSGEDTNSVLEGFTTKNGIGCGILCCNSSAATIVGNIITDNIAGGGYDGGGIYCFGDTAIITGNTIVGNTAHGIYFPWGYVTITGNCIANNAKDGISLETAYAIITDNIITSNTWNGIGVHGTYGEVIITNNAVIGNKRTGISICEGTVTGNTVTGNVTGIRCGGPYGGDILISNNVVTDNTGCGVISIGDYAVISGNTIAGNSGGISVYGPDYTSVTVAGNYINNNRAIHGGGIRLWPGSTYSFNVSITENTIESNTADSLGGGIYLPSWFENPYHIGFSILDNIITDNTAISGGGIWVSLNRDEWLSVSGSVKHNFITGNIATKGGGISINGDEGSEWNNVDIMNNVITNNEAEYGAGILCSDSTDVTVSHCTISTNNGDGIYCDSAAVPAVNYNDIVDNSGYGVRNVDAGVVIDVTHNWWGDPSGPGGVGPGTGDEVSDYVVFAPWLTGPVAVKEQEVVEVERRESSATIFTGTLRLAEGKKCRVFDITGRVVAPDKVRPGVYFIEVDGRITQKVVKVR